MKIHNRGMLVFGLFLLVVAAIILYAPSAEIHEHADFKVWLNRTVYNFSQEKYMSNGKVLSAVAHLHDGNGNVIHKHASGVTLGYFFRTLGMNFNSTCFVLDNGTGYCNSGDDRITMIVNEQINYQYDKYEFSDLDRILIAYGNYTAEELYAMMFAVSDDACISSNKCPGRGTPPPESCAGGICEE